MKHSSLQPESDRRVVAWALGAAVAASALLVAAAWSVRSEARNAQDFATKGSGFSYGYDDDFSYALLRPADDTQIGKTGDRDWKSIHRIMESLDEDALWFSLDSGDYVVRDEGTVRKAREVLAPMQELGERQGRLGAMQEELGRRQARIGARQAEIGARQAKLGVLQSRIATRNALGRDTPDSRREEEEISREMEELGRRQEELSRQQEPLSRRQEELGRRQEALGQQMGRLSAKATRDMRRLAEEALEAGKAERVEP